MHEFFEVLGVVTAVVFCVACALGLIAVLVARNSKPGDMP